MAQHGCRFARFMFMTTAPRLGQAWCLPSMQSTFHQPSRYAQMQRPSQSAPQSSTCCWCLSSAHASHKSGCAPPSRSQCGFPSLVVSCPQAALPLASIQWSSPTHLLEMHQLLAQRRPIGREMVIDPQTPPFRQFKPPAAYHEETRVVFENPIASSSYSPAR